MKLTTLRLELGLPKPLRFLHIADNHLTFADERDDQRKLTLAKARRRSFEGDTNNCEKYLDEMIAYAKDHCDLLLHTGDMLDFVSYRNFEVAREKLKDVDYFMAVGNHEFSLYVGEAWEDEAYKRQSYDRVQATFRNDMTFASREIGGVNLVAIDNSYYLFNGRQLELLKAEASKGLPMILMMHTPMYSEALYEEMMVVRKKPCAYVCGCPVERMAGYEDYRYRQQLADASTNAFIEYALGEPLVKAVLAGHLHFSHMGYLPGGRVFQSVAGAGYLNEASLLELV